MPLIRAARADGHQSTVTSRRVASTNEKMLSTRVRTLAVFWERARGIEIGRIERKAIIDLGTKRTEVYRFSRVFLSALTAAPNFVHI